MIRKWLLVEIIININQPHIGISTIYKETWAFKYLMKTNHVYSN